MVNTYVSMRWSYVLRQKQGQKDGRCLANDTLVMVRWPNQCPVLRSLPPAGLYPPLLSPFDPNGQSTVAAEWVKSKCGFQ